MLYPDRRRGEVRTTDGAVLDVNGFLIIFTCIDADAERGYGIHAWANTQPINVRGSGRGVDTFIIHLPFTRR